VSIVRDLVQALGGHLELGRSHMGGLRARVLVLRSWSNCPVRADDRFASFSSDREGASRTNGPNAISNSLKKSAIMPFGIQTIMAQIVDRRAGAVKIPLGDYMSQYCLKITVASTTRRRSACCHRQ
jgi:hypothetical protein